MTKNQIITILTDQGYQHAKTIVLHAAGIVLTTEGSYPEAHWTTDIQSGSKAEITGQTIKEITGILNFPARLTPNQKNAPISFTEERLKVDHAPEVLLIKQHVGWLHVAAFYEGETQPYHSMHSGNIDVVIDKPCHGGKNDFRY